MKKRNRQWLLILLGSLIIIIGVVVYIVFPLHQEKVNREAVAGQASTYYYGEFARPGDSLTAIRARDIVEGDTVGTPPTLRR